MVNKKNVRQTKKSSRLFYLSVVIFLIFGFVIFSIFVKTFSKTGRTINIPIAFPIVAVIIFYEGIMRGRDLSELGIKKDNFCRNVGIGILLAFLGFYVMFTIINIFTPGLMEEIVSRKETLSNFFRLNFQYPLNYILQTIYAFALLAPAEELLFRGFIQGKLQKLMNNYLAIIIQSSLFGLVHGIPAYMRGFHITYSICYGLVVFFGGILLGIAFNKTGNSIIAPWVAHAISDSPLTLLIFGII